MAATEKTLAGKRIVVTRAPEQAGDLCAHLAALGAEVYFLPAVKFAAPDDAGPLDHAVAEMDQFDWVIFTSRNAVKFVAARFPALGLSPERINRLMLSPQIAVIGPATRDEARSAGFRPSYEARESSGGGLAAELAVKVKGKRVLLPRSDRARPELPKLLREAGAEVVEVIAYKTIRPERFDPRGLEAIRGRNVDVITFFSPSAYQYLAEDLDATVLTGKSSKMVIATIGSTTSSEIRKNGLEVAIEAPSPSAEALCGAIVSYFQERATKRASSQ